MSADPATRILDRVEADLQALGAPPGLNREWVYSMSLSRYKINGCRTWRAAMQVASVDGMTELNGYGDTPEAAATECRSRASQYILRIRGSVALA